MRRQREYPVENCELCTDFSQTEEDRAAKESNTVWKQEQNSGWLTPDSAVSLHEDSENSLLSISMSSNSTEGQFSLKEGLALRLRDVAQAEAEKHDLGIGCDLDDTAKSDSANNMQTPSRRESTNLSDSAVSSNQTSLASSVSTEKPPCVWLVTNESGEVDESTQAKGAKSPDGQRQSYRRASSLKASRASDEGPYSHQKKAVRFADALGLDLTAVKQMMDAEFANPPSWCQPKAEVPSRKVLRPIFDQPASKLGTAFRQHVLDTKVCLENLLVNELTMIGSVRVANVAFEKRVFVRYTTDCWTHVADKEATYVSLSCDGNTDRFSFTVTAPADINQYGLAEFSVCFVANGVEYWDNNGGRNYVCEVVTEELGVSYGGDLGE